LRTWGVQGRGSDHLTTKKLIDDVRHQPRL
jgi:hypothetical protein